MNINDTICAIATAEGLGAISIIRLSGINTFAITQKIFTPLNGAKQLKKQKSHTIHLGYIMDEERVVDKVLLSIFKNPHSYTGEDVVEISCHGSNFIQNKILEILIKKGARLAKPGEFTMRAFFNGKIDLSQAEAVADLIASESTDEQQIALQQMRGGFSSELSVLRQKLIDFTALIELELDFSEEDVDFANREDLSELLESIKIKIKELVESFEYGNVIKQGVNVTIAGKPNAGKSSLLNTLFNEEKAIVSEIAGTTRDVIEDVLVIEGIKFRFFDTAGLRTTDDKIEIEGVKKAKEKISQSKFLLYLFDRNDTSPEEIIKEIKSLYHKNLTIFLIENKIDLNDGFLQDNFISEITKELFDKYSKNIIRISAQDVESVKKLKAKLKSTVASLKNNSSTIITNTRHLESLTKVLQSIAEAQKGLDINLSGDLLSFHLKEALFYIGEITGEVDLDKDILGTIFGKFCIGK